MLFAFIGIDDVFMDSFSKDFLVGSPDSNVRIHKESITTAVAVLCADIILCKYIGAICIYVWLSVCVD